MSARYHVLASDELMARAELHWPACLRAIEQEQPAETFPGAHWWLVEDDEADPALAGKRVELTITTGRISEDAVEIYDKPTITERRVMA